jgi:putative transposase
LARVKSVRLVVEELMNAEVSELIGAAHGERNPEGRMTKRSGYRGREWDTRVGVIELQIPKLRQGSYFPHGLLEPRKRGERALLAVVQQAYVCGVSRRRVDQGVGDARAQDLALRGVAGLRAAGRAGRALPAASARGRLPLPVLDAKVEKVRDGGRVVGKAV